MLKNLYILFLSLCVLSIVSCGNDDDSDSNPAGIATKYYFVGDIGENRVKIEHGDTDVFRGFESTDQGSFSCRKGYEVGLSSLLDPSAPELSIGFEGLLSYETSCDVQQIREDFISAFAVGTYDFRNENAAYADSPEVFVFYTDENGVEWSSSQGAQNASSNFMITQSGETTSNEYFSNQIVEVKSTFNCTLYNASGESMELRNGEAFYLYFNN